MAGQSLHPAQNRGLRELHAMARQLARHWDALRARIPAGEAADALEQGSAAARRMLKELEPLTSSYGLPGRVMAQGLGARVAGARAQVRDRALERNQALRLAVLDMQHVTTLLLYQAELAEAHGDERLAAFCRKWERSLRRIENNVRRAAAEAGRDADAAVLPLDESPAGRAAHGVGFAIGSFGEWADKQLAKRRG